MDKTWVGYAKQIRIRRILAGSVATVAFLPVAWVVPGVEPAVPGVDAAVVFTDTVKRGEMVRPVRGIGILVPETVAVIAATVSGGQGLSEHDRSPFGTERGRHGGPVRHVGVGRL